MINMLQRRIYVFPHCTVDDLRGFTEIFFLVPYLNVDLYKNLLSIIDWHNDGLFSSLYFNEPPHERVSLEECEYALVPFKYQPGDSRIIEACHKAAAHDKKVIAFYCDDNDKPFELPSNLILFRTSVNKSTMQPQERVFPAMVADYFPGNVELPNTPKNFKIGYCGREDGFRKSILDTIQSLNLETDIQYTGAFWGTRADLVDKLNSKRKFHRSLLENQFALCARGEGNFSYRFYEALSFGCIPVLIDTDTVLPFEKIIPWDDYIIRIKKEDLEKLPNLIHSSWINPQKNRLLWQKYFSPSGFNKKFLEEI